MGSTDVHVSDPADVLHAVSICFPRENDINGLLVRYQVDVFGLARVHGTADPLLHAAGSLFDIMSIW